MEQPIATTQIFNANCLEKMKDLDDKSVDLIFCDLPYNQTSCAWDVAIDLDLFWKEVMRIKKLNTPIFFTTTTKFGVSLIQSAPKKCFFRYDLVWVKSAPAGFLTAKKMPMRKHEMIYVFYEKLPFYNLSSHTHKFIKEVPTKRHGKDNVDNVGMIKNRCKSGMETQNKYDPALPVSVVKEPEPEPVCNNRKAVSLKKSDIYGKDLKITTHYEDENGKRINTPSHHYDPPLPVSVVKEDSNIIQKIDKNNSIIKKQKEDNNYNKTYKNDCLMGNDFKNFRGGVKIYEPALPVSVVKDESSTIYNNKGKSTTPITKHPVQGQTTGQPRYDPPLPDSMLEIKSTRGKHSTEKPVALMEWVLKYYSKEGDMVLDPTCGSGSTGVACKNMNRNFIGIEMDEDIFKVAENRLK